MNKLSPLARMRLKQQGAGRGAALHNISVVVDGYLDSDKNPIETPEDAVFVSGTRTGTSEIVQVRLLEADDVEKYKDDSHVKKRVMKRLDKSDPERIAPTIADFAKPSKAQTAVYTPAGGIVRFETCYDRGEGEVHAVWPQFISRDPAAAHKYLVEHVAVKTVDFDKKDGSGKARVAQILDTKNGVVVEDIAGVAGTLKQVVEGELVDGVPYSFAVINIIGEGLEKEPMRAHLFAKAQDAEGNSVSVDDQVSAMLAQKVDDEMTYGELILGLYEDGLKVEVIPGARVLASHKNKSLAPETSFALKQYDQEAGRFKPTGHYGYEEDASVFIPKIEAADGSMFQLVTRTYPSSGGFNRPVPFRALSTPGQTVDKKAVMSAAAGNDQSMAHGDTNEAHVAEQAENGTVDMPDLDAELAVLEGIDLEELESGEVPGPGM